MSQPANLVTALDIREIRVEGLTRRLRSALEARGIRVVGGTIQLVDEAQMIVAAETLVEHDALFSGGPAGWPPAAVLGQLKEDGKFSREFREIVWRAPGEFSVTTR